MLLVGEQNTAGGLLIALAAAEGGYHEKTMGWS